MTRASNADGIDHMSDNVEGGCLEKSHWSAMYVGVADLVMIDDNDAETQHHVAFKNLIEKHSSCINHVELPRESTVMEESETTATTIDGRETKDNDENNIITTSENESIHTINKLMLERDELRSKIISFKAEVTSNQKRRRMSRMDHEVLHAALTQEIFSLTSSLKDMKEQLSIEKMKYKEAMNQKVEEEVQKKLNGLLQENQKKDDEILEMQSIIDQYEFDANQAKQNTCGCF